MQRVIKLLLPLVFVIVLITVFCTVSMAASGDVVTEYGTIPADIAADTKTNTLVMFADGEYVTASNNWLGTGGMAEFLVANSAEAGQACYGKDVVVLLRSEEALSGNNVAILGCQFKSLTLDLGGNTLTVTSGNFISENITDACASNVNITIKNGSVSSTGSLNRSLFFNIETAENTEDITFNIRYENLTLEGPKPFFNKNGKFGSGQFNVYLTIIDTKIKPNDANKAVSEPINLYYLKNSKDSDYKLILHNVTLDTTDINDGAGFGWGGTSAVPQLYLLPTGADAEERVIECNNDTAAIEKEYENAKVSVCLCGKTRGVEFKGDYVPKVNATLENNFGLNLYIPSVFGISDIKINGKPYTENVSTAIRDDGIECHVITVSDIYADIAGTSYKISYALDPDGDGEAAAIKASNTISIPKYSTLMLNQYANDTEAKQMMADALNYAKAAADYTKNTSGAEYANVEAAIATYANAGVNATAPTVTGAKETNATEGIDGVTFVLGQTTAMRIYITAGYEGNITVTGTGINGTYTSADYKTDDVGTYVDVEAKAYHIANDVTITTDTGSTEFNLATYIELISTQGDDNATAAAKALYAYALSAAAYQNK